MVAEISGKTTTANKHLTTRKTRDLCVILFSNPSNMPRYPARRGTRKTGRSYKRKAVRRPRSRLCAGAPMRPITALGTTTSVYRKHTSYSSSALQTTSPGGTNAGVGYLLSVDLAAFGAQATRMLAAFDQYAIVNARVTLIPQANSFPVVPGATAICGPLGVTVMAVDIDGALSGSPPPSAISVLSHENVKTATHDKTMSTGWFQPKPCFVVSDGTVAGVASAPMGQLTWVDSTNSGSLAHYGVVIWIDIPQVASTIVRYDLKVEAVVAYRIGV